MWDIEQTACTESTRPALGLVSLTVAWGSGGGGDFLSPYPLVQRGPPRLLVGRQLLAESPGQAQPGGGQRAQLEGAPRQSVRVGLGGQGRQAVTVPRDPSTGFPGSCPTSNVAKGSGVPTTYTYPTPSSQALPALETYPILPSLGKCWPVWLGPWLTSEPQFLHW